MKVECEHTLHRERVNCIVMNVDRWCEFYDVQFANNL